MISLKTASNIAKKISSNSEGIPGHSGLRSWSSKGCISRPIKLAAKSNGRGRIGKYDDTLPIQIAIVSELKNNYTLDDISKISSVLLPKLIEFKNQGKLFQKIAPNSFYEFKEKIIQEVITENKTKKSEILNLNNKQSSEVLKKYINAEKKAKEIAEKKKMILLTENYLKSWKEKFERYQTAINQKKAK